MPLFIILAVTKAIEEATMLKDLESRRMKCQKVLKDPCMGVVYRNFLQEAGEGKDGQPNAPKSNPGLSNMLGGLG